MREDVERSRTKNDDMTDSDVPQRLALSIRERFVDLGERVLPLNHRAEGSVLAVEVVEVRREGEEELAACSPSLSLAGDGHRKGSGSRVLESREDLGLEEGRRGVVGRGAGELVEDGGASRAGVGRVTSLSNEVLDDVVEGTEVVAVRFAELEEVERGARAEGGVQVDLWELGQGQQGREMLQYQLQTMMSPSDVSNRTDCRRARRGQRAE